MGERVPQTMDAFEIDMDHIPDLLRMVGRRALPRDVTVIAVDGGSRWGLSLRMVKLPAQAAVSRGMGCDIHLAVQARDPETGTWATLPPAELGPLFDRFRDYPRFGLSAFHRDYAVFVFLTGVDRKAGPVAHFAKRGLPADTDEVPSRPRPAFDAGAADEAEHSFTWATFGELLAADWSPLLGEPRGFLLWLRSPEMTALVEKHGPENLRLLIGLDN